MHSTIQIDEDLRQKGYAFRTVRGVGILITKDGKSVRAFHNRCPHLGCPLSRGRVEGRTLVCPCHEWRFDLSNGEMELSREIKLKEFKVAVSGSEINIEMED
jgi:3-phenylpropionate/trans-cinnamate dioxygenase ferredoxin subunit